jgi:hypothetical protein
MIRKYAPKNKRGIGFKWQEWPVDCEPGKRIDFRALAGPATLEIDLWRKEIKDSGILIREKLPMPLHPQVIPGRLYPV